MLSPAAVANGQGAGSGAESPAASATRHPPPPPTAHFPGVVADSVVVVNGGGVGSASSPYRLARRAISAGAMLFAGDDLDDRISKLPDVLFPFEGHSGDDELTPFKAVYGSSPNGGVAGASDSLAMPSASRGGGNGGGGGGGWRAIHYDNRDSKHNGSPGSRFNEIGSGRGSRGSSSPHKTFPHFASSAPVRGGEHTFGGRQSLTAALPASDRRLRYSVSGGGGGDGNLGGRYPPPNQRGGGDGTSFDSPSHSLLLSRISRGNQGGGKGGATRHNDAGGDGGSCGGGGGRAGKKNPATPGFTGAGFRDIRDVHVSTVHAFLCARAVEGAPWVTLSGKDSVAAACDKPLTVPESYAQFFRGHASVFELSPDGRHVAAKLPGEDHACIPAPPVSLLASPSSDGGLSASVPCRQSVLATGGAFPGSGGGGGGSELQLRTGSLPVSMPLSSSPSPSPSSTSTQRRGRSGKPAHVGTPSRPSSFRAQSNRSHSSSDGSHQEKTARGHSTNSCGGEGGEDEGEGKGRGKGEGGGENSSGSGCDSGGDVLLCMYLSRPGGCQAGDACRFSHAAASASAAAPVVVVLISSKPAKLLSTVKAAKKQGGGGYGANVALPA
mmetsp:Transcript_22531/g.36267  ORF Transcript_22531/g.36267 Transcript_22531/m.36267 type:complete len:610 (-) Transcript_22531:206-2035(-)